MSILQKTIRGLLWSFIDIIGKQGINFIIGIILARLLSPFEFGLVGMVTIFIALSDTFIDGGFQQALLRKINCTQAEYCTVFYFNLAIGSVLYLVLFFFAGSISNFFNEPQLTDLLKVLGLVVIIKSFALIQTVILYKRLDFKLLTKISIISSIFSGAIGVYMAYSGFGVWSLAAKTVLGEIFLTGLLWYFNKWRSSLVFDLNAFKELFGFGYKVLLNSILGQIFDQLFKTVIAKNYSAETLGYFTRAEQFNSLPSATLSGVIQRVTLPVLAQIQNEKERLKKVYQKFVKATMLVSFSMMIGLAAISHNLILVLIGEQWIPAVLFLQLLCFASMLYPLHHFNYTILNLKGRSDLVLKGNIILRILTIPTILMGIYFSIYLMIIGMIFNTLIAYIIFSRWAGKMIEYPVKEQIRDLGLPFISAIIMGAAVFSLPIFFNLSPEYLLSLQILTGLIIFVALSLIFNRGISLEIVSTIKSYDFKTKQDA